jgi:hypothetical protein
MSAPRSVSPSLAAEAAACAARATATHLVRDLLDPALARLDALRVTHVTRYYSLPPGVSEAASALVPFFVNKVKSGEMTVADLKYVRVPGVPGSGVGDAPAGGGAATRVYRGAPPSDDEDGF